MPVRVGQLFRKRTVRSLSGDIIDMSDDTIGGVIISKGRIVNQEAVDEIVKKEEDKKNAATAFTQPSVAPPEAVAERNVSPSKVEKLEKKVEDMESNISAILKILQNDKRSNKQD